MSVHGDRDCGGNDIQAGFRALAPTTIRSTPACDPTGHARVVAATTAVELTAALADARPGDLIAHDVAQAHGGSLTLRNRAEGGLTAELRLPRRHESRAVAMYISRHVLVACGAAATP